EEQLAIAARSYPTDRMVVLEHLRLLTRTRADIRQIGPWIALAHKLYAEDFDCCFALAHYLYLTEQDPAPPQPENLEPALERLGAEMRVFRALADYILKPQGELPSSASPELRTNLPLAYLARCASVKPGDINVLEFAARYVDMLGCRFQDWATTHPDLE